MMNNTKSLHRINGKKTFKQNEYWTADWRNDFIYPQAEISFHFWDNAATCMHTHNYYEFFIVTKGKLSHTINGQQSTLPHGTICFITPTDKHSVQPIEGSVTQHINLALTCDKLKMLCDAVSPSVFPLLTKKSTRFVLDGNDLNYFINKSEQLNYSYTRNNSDATNLFLIIEMLIGAISNIYRKIIKIDSQLPEWFNNLLYKIDQMDFSSLKVSDVYPLSNYSPSSLLKYFDEYLGETITSYISKIKINKACTLLTNTNYTVLYIAELVGYNALAHFNRTFKKYTGQTPKEYRKASKQNTENHM